MVKVGVVQLTVMCAIIMGVAPPMSVQWCEGTMVMAKGDGCLGIPDRPPTGTSMGVWSEWIILFVCVIILRRTPVVVR